MNSFFCLCWQGLARKYTSSKTFERLVMLRCNFDLKGGIEFLSHSCDAGSLHTFLNNCDGNEGGSTSKLNCV